MKMRHALSAGAVLLLLTACGGSEETPEASAENGDVSVTKAEHPDPQAIQKVDDLFNVTPTMHQALQRSLQTCMAEKGLTWTEIEQENLSVRDLVRPKPMTVEEARVSGYPAAETGAQAAPPFTEEQMTAWMGTPDSEQIMVDGVGGSIAEDGCLARSYEEVFGSAEAGVLFQGGSVNLPLPYLNAANQDAVMTEKFKEWSSCMSEKGFDYANPTVLNIDETSSTIEVAVADAQCREDVDYEKTFTDTLNAYLTTFLSDEQAILDQMANAKKSAEQNAPGILGS